MTDEERAQSERRRKLIWEQNRAANPYRPNRVIAQNTLEQDLAALLGDTLPDRDQPVDWKALTSSG